MCTEAVLLCNDFVYLPKGCPEPKSPWINPGVGARTLNLFDGDLNSQICNVFLVQDIILVLSSIRKSLTQRYFLLGNWGY